MDFINMIHKFTVVPSLSGELSALQRIAYNMFWCWEPEATNLFRRMDPDLWQKTRHNPVEMLGILQQTTLELLKSDEGFMAHLRLVDEPLVDQVDRVAVLGRLPLVRGVVPLRERGRKHGG